MPAQKQISYKDLLGRASHKSKNISSSEVLQLLKQAEAIPQKLLPFNGIIHLIDYTQRSHVALSGEAKSMMGYDPRDVIENGLDFVIDIFHKDDFKIYDQKIFPRVASFLRETPQDQHGAYLFSYSYRMKKSDGKWLNLFQQGSYITDPKTSLPLYGIAMVTDLTPLKKDTSMIFSIDKRRDCNDKSIFGTNVLTDFYYPDPVESMLTHREIQILSLLAGGNSTKLIAHKFSISENTVANHRKNMLKKTGTKNIAELITYAVRKGII